MSRKQVTVRMDGEIWELFKDFVKHKRERFKGVAGEEVEAALKAYMLENDWPDAEHYREDHDQDTLDRFTEGRNPPKQDQPVKHQGQPSETDAYIAGLDPKYKPVVAELEGMNEINREGVYEVLTRRLNLKTDKSRRDNLRTLKYCGFLESHPVAGDNVFKVNHDFSLQR